MRVIGDIDTHEWLARPNGLPDINETLGYLAGNAKSEVALNAGGDNACECAIPRWASRTVATRTRSGRLLGSSCSFVLQPEMPAVSRTAISNGTSDFEADMVHSREATGVESNLRVMNVSTHNF